MIPVVLDASVVGAACGWTSEPYQCVVLVARRRLRSFVTQAIVEEWRSTITKMQSKGAQFRRSPWPTLDGLVGLSRLVSPAPLGKQRSRDRSDDPYLACALAARANFIITRDPDLLDLEKPFGIEILTPRSFLSRLNIGC
jgi:putative PIN family toxin of toxin-antitoxin system